jgi:hypothetical protein
MVPSTTLEQLGLLTPAAAWGGARPSQLQALRWLAGCRRPATAPGWAGGRCPAAPAAHRRRAGRGGRWPGTVGAASAPPAGHVRINRRAACSQHIPPYSAVQTDSSIRTDTTSGRCQHGNSAIGACCHPTTCPHPSTSRWLASPSCTSPPPSFPLPPVHHLPAVHAPPATPLPLLPHLLQRGQLPHQLPQRSAAPSRHLGQPVATPPAAVAAGWN